MRHRRLALPLFLLALFTVAFAAQVSLEDEAHAEFLEVWAQGQGGYLTGFGSNSMGGSGMPYYGFAAGVELLMIDAFIDIRMEDWSSTPDSDDYVPAGGTWNQLGLGFDTIFNEDGTVRFMLGGRAGYVYGKFSKASAEKFAEDLENGETDSDVVPNKGLNFSTQAALDIKIVGPLSVGIMADVGYHVLLPDSEMGLNVHGLGYLRLGLGF